MAPSLHLIKLQRYPIFQQLQLEEALLRADERQWCLINEGSDPAIVVGISGKPQELINQDKFNKHPIPVIRRFSGGGTVFVDHQTIFTTFICNMESIKVSCCPQQILRWTEELYRPVFDHPEFCVRENDYVFGDRKFGGNAQYLRKGRWLHHSTFLWDYDPHHMDYLTLPKKKPAYREQRQHGEFLCKMSLHVEHGWIERLEAALHRYFTVSKVALEDALAVVKRSHRQATTLISSDLGR